MIPLKTPVSFRWTVPLIRISDDGAGVFFWTITNLQNRIQDVGLRASWCQKLDACAVRFFQSFQRQTEPRVARNYRRMRSKNFICFFDFCRVNPLTFGINYTVSVHESSGKQSLVVKETGRMRSKNFFVSLIFAESILSLLESTIL
jgi:hypothetical protein